MGSDDERHGGEGEATMPYAPALAGDALWAEPPADLLGRIEAELTERRSGAATRLRRRPRFVVIGVAAASLIALITGFLVGSLRNDSPDDGPPPIAAATLVGTDHAPDAVATVEAFDRGAGFSIILQVAGLAPAPVDGYYEGLVESADGAAVSVGTFHMRGGDDTVVLWSGVDLVVYSALSVRAVGPDGIGDEVLRGELGPR